MNGIHDMGGMHGFGPVPIEQGEPVFHAPWEGRVYAMAIAAGKKRLTEPVGLRAYIEGLDPRPIPRLLLLRTLDGRPRRRSH